MRTSRVRAFRESKASFMTWAVLNPRAMLRALVARFISQTGEGSAQSAATPNVHANAARPKPPPAVRQLRLRPDVERPLLDAGMPPEGSSIYEGPKRPRDTPEEAARKFVLWAQVVGV